MNTKFYINNITCGNVYPMPNPRKLKENMGGLPLAILVAPEIQQWFFY